MNISESKVTFISSPKHKGLRIFDHSKQLAKFESQGEYGLFTTDDPQLAKRLEGNPQFGKTFYKAGGKMPKFAQQHISHGAPINDVKQEAIDKGAIRKEVEKSFNENLIPKTRRLGFLEAAILKKDGSFRGDATEEQIEEYKQLKKDLGEGDG